MYVAATDPDPTIVRARVRELVAAHGVAPTARLLGMSRHAILGLTGPGVVHAGTVVMAAVRLAALPSSSAALSAIPPVTA